MSEPVRVSGDVRDVARRALRHWPIGLAVAAVTAIVGLAVTWETPRVFATRATVFPPASVANALAGQRYINDMQAAINSPAVQRDVAADLGVSPSAFGGQVAVRRIRQSSVMDILLRSPDRLTDPADALKRLITRAGQSLAAPDVSAAEAQQARAKANLATAEEAAVAAKKAREALLADRDGVTPASELAILGPELADVRLCATGTIVPPGSSVSTCNDQLKVLQAEALELQQADDELAALDRDLAQAESDVAEAERDQRDADAAVARASAAPVAEVSEAGREISQVPSLLRRSAAVIGAAVLLGLAVMVALALLTPAEQTSGPEAGREDVGRPKRVPVS